MKAGPNQQGNGHALSAQCSLCKLSASPVKYHDGKRGSGERGSGQWQRCYSKQGKITSARPWSGHGRPTLSSYVYSNLAALRCDFDVRLSGIRKLQVVRVEIPTCGDE
jgi:hypothetical protein